MHMKSLSLKGFKSFADKSMLNLEQGITAIVGPNGSGKSNISDAVLWVLGERNAKNIRGQYMEDVIFAGSAGRSGAKYAEVELVLDNSDGKLPVEYNEIAIARRMYRNGESEYLINGTIVRRLDILDILHDSGVGSDTHTIISQGNLDELLNSKPQERRTLIEEAAGVLKHKQRLKKSSHKLDHMNNQLLRINDISNEINRQLGPLKRKATRAIQYKKLKSRLEEIKLELAVDDLRNLKDKYEDNELKQKNSYVKLNDKSKVCDYLQKQIDEIESKYRISNQEALSVNEQLRSMLELQHRFEGIQNNLDNKMHQANEKIETYKEFVCSFEFQSGQITREFDRLRALDNQLSDEIESEGKKLQKANKDYEQAKSKQIELSSELTKLKSKYKELSLKIESTGNKINIYEKNKSEINSQLNYLEIQISEYNKQIITKEEELNNLSKLNEKLEKSVKCLKDNNKKIEVELDAKINEISKLRFSLEDLQDKRQILQAEILSLTELDKKLSSANFPGRTWILDNSKSISFKVHPLNHLIKIDEKYAAALESALGFNVSTLILDEENSSDTLSILKEKVKSGVVLKLIKGRQTFNNLAEKLKKSKIENGIILSKLIEVKNEAKDYIDELLGDVVFVEDIFAILKKIDVSPDFRIVDTGGNLLEPSGTLYLKSNAISKNVNKSSIVLSVKIRKLKIQENNLVKEIDNQQKLIEVAHKQENILRKQNFELSESLATENVKLNIMKSEEIDNKNTLSNLKADLEESSLKMHTIEKDLKKSYPKIDVMHKQLKNDEAKLKEINKRIDILDKDGEKIAAEIEKISVLRNELSILLVRKKERKSFINEQLKSAEKDIVKLNTSKSKADKDSIKQAKIVEISKDFSSLIDKFCCSLAKLSDCLEVKFKSAQTGAQANQNNLIDLQEQKHQVDSELDSIKTLINNLKIDSGRLEVQVQNAINIIVQDLQMPIEHALELPLIKDRANKENEILKIERDISSMKEVNTDAYQQYEELKERYEYINKQVNDLKSAAKKLSEIDIIIQERIKVAFKECFELANKNFKEIFSILFPGGTGHLELVEYKNDDGKKTEPGIEVIAQPKGKRFKRMTLMSGGEKTLIALALLFAVYRIRRAPFYILDEAEAALDDINLSRLIRYFEDLRQDNTQLILITHQRRTMEISDVLFGVSMQANGITKVINQRLRH